MSPPLGPAGGPPPPRLLDRVRATIRARHYSPRTETAYVGWIRRFVLFNQRRHPNELGAQEVSAFLEHLACRRRVSASTQNQALSALLFLYGEVLGHPLDGLHGVVRAKQPRHLPVVLTRREVAAVLSHLCEPTRLMASLLYGSGLRLLECCTLRVKDVDFDRHEITVRAAKGGQSRVTMLPSALRGALRLHLRAVKAQHEADLRRGAGSVELPAALATKYPRAPWEWGWQWVFPATRHYVARVTGVRRRHHLHEPVLEREFKHAVRLAGLAKPAGVHALRGIRLRPTCWRMVTTSGQFRSSWGTAASPPR